MKTFIVIIDIVTKKIKNTVILKNVHIDAENLSYV
jgi:hypothetical protein